MQFVTNVVFAHFVLREKIRRRTLLGTLVLISGVALVVRYSCHRQPGHRLHFDRARKALVAPAYLMYLAILLVLWLMSLAISTRLRAVAARDPKAAAKTCAGRACPTQR